ncbi:aerobic respiration two-component sensor histidine kinase ArcB [Vibrio gangliei]|uniref:aerobic respiration two-component sensor histidine kinase ArcB n=1 Tax=Vibrio gangliei TaxID=2077090 RepID=UPI000D01BBD2|nr:aerobic respiration two-component sensor histidine kinase ArcB [Vibrio gangliei]
MKLLKKLAQYYVDLLVKLGMVRFSMLLALALVCFSVSIQAVVSIIWRGEVDNIVIIRSIFFGLLITPWAVYFLTVVVDQLEESRQKLSNMVVKLKDMRQRDHQLNLELQQNIHKLNQEIIEREKAEEARLEMMQDLENEVYHRERTQMELAESTSLMRSFLDASPDLIYYRSTEGVFLGCNKSFEELLGMPQSELVGMSIDDVYKDEATLRQIKSTDNTVFTENRELAYDIWLEYPNGRKAFFEFRKLPFYSKSNELLGLVGFGRDITERKAYQDALVKASQDKITFISTISHELRTPLNGIVGLSRMLLDSKLDQEQRQYMQTINISAITLGHIFNDVIDLDKLDRTQLELLPVETDLQAFITDIETISGLMAEQKGLSFELDQLTDLPDAIMVDATRLRQVLWNLLNNAMKFTKQGGVTVNVSAEFDDEWANLEFEIEDTGIGIPESEIDNIFGMYYQVKSGKDNLHAVGTGIGLAISKEFARRMNGDITVSSELGFGSTFTVSIKVPVAHLEATSEELNAQTSLRIFMVEDIELNVTVARSVLENLGHSVEVAMSGEEALSKFNPERYDLVFLDIQLPDMTGFDIAQNFRKHYQTLPPLVALTANVMKDKQEYLTKSMDDVISKPLAVKDVYHVINKFAPSSSELAQLETQGSHSESNQTESAENGIIDTDMLLSYIEIVGTQPVLDSVAMFESAMPNYMSLLNQYLAEQDDDNVVSEAHKIKGAAGSVGLQRIQRLAQLAQTPEAEEWREKVAGWVEEINQNYQKDIELLKVWMKQQG